MNSNERTRIEAVRLLQETPAPTRAAVARELGVPVTTVQYWAMVAGIPPGKQGRPRALPEHSYRLLGSVQIMAIKRLREYDVSDVAGLLSGLADGSLRIIRN